VKSITVYQTDADGAYAHEAQAHELPLEPGVFNVPYGALLTPPPETEDGQVAVAISGDNWTVMTDHRNDTLYRTDNGEPYARGTVVNIDGQPVRYIGLDTIPDWLTLEAPDPKEPTHNDDAAESTESAG